MVSSVDWHGRVWPVGDSRACSQGTVSPSEATACSANIAGGMSMNAAMTSISS
jgi:hypothetical protein